MRLGCGDVAGCRPVVCCFNNCRTRRFYSSLKLVEGWRSIYQPRTLVRPSLKRLDITVSISHHPSPVAHSDRSYFALQSYMPEWHNNIVRYVMRRYDTLERERVRTSICTQKKYTSHYAVTVVKSLKLERIAYCGCWQDVADTNKRLSGGKLNSLMAVGFEKVQNKRIKRSKMIVTASLIK